jgi:hypothetical protein
MKAGIFPTIVMGLAFCAGACAQQSPAAPAPDQPVLQTPGVGPGGWQTLRPNGGQGMPSGRSQGMPPGRGLQGTVTAVAADHYTIKTEAGDVYTVSFSANTRIMKQPALRNMPGQPPTPGINQRTPPQLLKPTDIKVGDPVAAIGQVDPTTKAVGAIVILLVDPERAKMMREMQANYGKTWLQGKVTAIDGVKVTVMGSIDNVSHTIVADESTTFRRRRDPITLADIHEGDMMRAEGALKDGTFVAARVMVMGTPPAATPTIPPPADPQPQSSPQ